MTIINPEHLTITEFYFEKDHFRERLFLGAVLVDERKNVHSLREHMISWSPWFESSVSKFGHFDRRSFSERVQEKKSQLLVDALKFTREHNERHRISEPPTHS